jgi:hypothetical protein
MYTLSSDEAALVTKGELEEGLAELDEGDVDDAGSDFLSALVK